MQGCTRVAALSGTQVPLSRNRKVDCNTQVELLSKENCIHDHRADDLVHGTTYKPSQAWNPTKVSLALLPFPTATTGAGILRN